MDMQFKYNGKMVISFSGEESGSVEDFKFSNQIKKVDDITQKL